MPKPNKHAPYRSGMERRLVPPILASGGEYERHALTYPKKDGRYLVDVVLPNGIAIEIKGWFKPADRTKMLAVKAAHPAIDLRIVLGNPRTTLSPRSATTLAAWCETHGFPWADNEIPSAWLTERVNWASLAALEAARVRAK